MDEAQKGYDALLIRRRGGAQKFLSLVMGSVSTKLVEKVGFLPVMLVGVQKVNHSIIVAVDGSEGAKRAVEFTAKFLEGSECKVVLCTVLRDFDVTDGNKNKKSEACITVSFDEIEAAVKEARENRIFIPERCCVYICFGYCQS